MGTRSATDGFTAFATEAAPRLLRTAYLLCGDRGDAEDVVQDALARCFVRWRRLRAENAYAYARAAVVNACRDRWRRHGRRGRALPLEGVDRADPVDRFHEVDTRRALLGAMTSLSPQQRAVLVLRYWEGMTENEIAAHLDVSAGAVKSYASRAIARLRQELPAGEPLALGRNGDGHG